MNSYPLRNLALAIVDDEVEKRLESRFELVDLVGFPSDAENRLSTLAQHCRNAATEKQLRFDLCSIDMNFQADLHDPMRPPGKGAHMGVADPEKMTASGLYHGMILLARREATDDAGNVVPLVWEVRSATPHQFGSRRDLVADAVRGYSLLRSLLASPTPGETLEECLQRELQLEHPGAAPLKAGTLLSMMQEDLQRQSPSGGSVQEILEKLLPRWRLALRLAMESREVEIFVPEMKRQLEKLTTLSKAGAPDLDVTAPTDLCIPIQGNKDGEVQCGIRLASIMADLVAGGRIDVQAKAEAMEPGQKPLSVLDWFDWLVKIASSGHYGTRLFALVRDDFERTIGGREDTTGVGRLWNSYQRKQGSSSKRLLLYILMRARLWVTRAAEADRDPVDQASNAGEDSLAKIYGFQPNHPVLFWRPLNDNKILNIAPSDLRAALLQALDGRGGTLIAGRLWDDWLAEALRNYCLAPNTQHGLQISEAELRSLAPGLFR